MSVLLNAAARTFAERGYESTTETARRFVRLLRDDGWRRLFSESSSGWRFDYRGQPRPNSRPLTRPHGGSHPKPPMRSRTQKARTLRTACGSPACVGELAGGRVSEPDSRLHYWGSRPPSRLARWLSAVAT
jgi:hypothetical protein